MKVASQAYLDAMSQTVRPTSQVEIRIKYASEDVHGEASSSSPAYYASPILESNATNVYTAIENNFMTVGGNQLIPPASSSGVQPNGYVSQQMTNSTGAFDAPITLTVTLPKASTFAGLRVRFVDAFPLDAEIKAYTGSSFEKFSMPIRQLEWRMYHGFDSIDKLEIVFTKLSKPFRKLRIASCQVLGDILYDNNNIISLTDESQRDPVGDGLYNHTVQFTVDNSDGLYDLDNPDGMWARLRDTLPATIRYGAETAEGISWLPPTTLFLEGEPSANQRTATLTIKDALAFLESDYAGGVFHEQGVLLSELAKDVLAYNGSTAFSLDMSGSVTDTTTQNPLPIAPGRECLQVIANAIGTTVSCGDDGRIVIKDDSPARRLPSNNDVLTWDSLIGRPTITRRPLLREFRIGIVRYERDGEVTKLSEATFDPTFAGDTAYLTLSYSPATDLSRTIENGYDADGSMILGATGSSVFLTSTDTSQVKVTVSGTPLKETNSSIVVLRDTDGSRNTGETVKVENPLIDKSGWVREIGDPLCFLLDCRSSYMASIRQDFRLQAGDIIWMQTAYRNKVPAVITEVKYKLPGQTGSIKALVLESEGGL